MFDIGIAGLILTTLIFIVSYKGFKNEFFVKKYEFEIDKILINKEYYRLISSGFLHVSWTHLIFNVVSLLAFCGLLESNVGIVNFAMIYFVSLIGGDLFSLFIHRMHGDYHSVGASGAVCGVVFSCIVLNPGLDIGFVGLPIEIPAWFYGIVYILVTTYGIKSDKGNIAHEAHLGGIILGLITAILIRPSILQDNLTTILIIAIPSIFFSLMLLFRPNFLIINHSKSNSTKTKNHIDHFYNENKVKKEKEIDLILDKINRRGIHSLTTSEREILDNFSKK